MSTQQSKLFSNNSTLGLRKTRSNKQHATRSGNPNSPPPRAPPTTINGLKIWIEEFFTDKINSLEDTLEETIEKMSLSIRELQEENQTLKKDLKRINSSLEKLENGKREKNIVLFGIQRMDNEDSVLCAKETIKNLLDLDVVRVNSAFRAGRHQNAPIIVSLDNIHDRDKIIRNGKKLKGTKIAVSRDYIKATRDKRKLLNVERLKAIAQGKKAVLRDDYLVIDGQTFIVDDDNSIVPLRKPNSPLVDLNDRNNQENRTSNINRQ